MKITEADKIDFIDDLLKVCHKHRLWLVPEDPYIGLNVTRQDAMDYIKEAPIADDEEIVLW